MATSQPLAAQAGLRMLLASGNAVDAAIATAITLTVVEPTSNGIGSDAFAIVWDGTTLHGLNASGRSPAAWVPERFAGLNEMPRRGWDSVTVPGAVSAWQELSNRFGKLPFARLFEPALHYARDGYPVSPVIAGMWKRAAEVLWDQPGFAEAFMPEGTAPEPGEIFRCQAMAKTLARLAETEGESFYRGEIAEHLVAFSDRCGGCLTLDDLASHRADWCGTISQRWHGYDVHEIPPNGQGIAALIALGILQRVSGFSDLPPDSIESVHLQIEAMKLAFADLHRHVSDPEHMEIEAHRLLDPAYLDGRARLVNPDRAGSPQCGELSPAGTVYLTAADESGMMVSYIQSNYMGFGSGVVVPGTGISLQNRGCGFRAQAGHPNSVGPRKRPFHTIIPGFVTRPEGNAGGTSALPGGTEGVMSFGVMGGPMQAQGHVQMAVRVLLRGQNPQAASDAPRWQVMEDGSVAVEEAMPAAVVEGLQARGHRVTVEPGWSNQAFGGAQLIMRHGDSYVAGSEGRKDGMAVAF